MASKAAFSFSISPPKNSQVTAQDEYEVLVLAPFNPTPKVTFQNIKINREAKRKLIIRNPTQSNVKVDLPKLPPEERHLQFSTTEIELGPGGETCLEVSWVPQEAGSWRDSVPVRTSSKFKADIIIICSSVDPNAAKSRKKPLMPRGCGRPSVLSKKVITPKASRKTGTVVTSKKLLRKAPSDAAPSPRRQTFLVKPENKENRAPLNLLPDFDNEFILSPVGASFMQMNDEAPFISVNESSVASFMFDPPLPTEDPRRCSTGIKSSGALEIDVSPCVRKDLFGLDQLDHLSPQGFFQADHLHPDTFQKERLSTGTYVKDRLSTDTYVKDRLSTGTYVKDRLSTGTYVKDQNSHSSEHFGSDFDFLSFVETPSFPSASPKAATECHVDDGFVAQWRSPLQSIKEEDQAIRQVTSLQVPEPYVLHTSPNAPTKSIKEETQDSREASLDPPVDLLKVVKPVVLHISPPSAPPGQRRTSKVSPALKKGLSKLSKNVGTMNVRQSADSCSINPTGSTRLQPNAVLRRQSFSVTHGSVQKSKEFHPSLPKGSASNAQLRRSSIKGIPSTAQSRLKLSGTVPRVSQKVAKRQQEESEFLFNTDDIFAEMINKEPFVGTAASDPFLSSSVYYDDAWKARQEKDMIKWLNAVLTPPAELATDDNMPTIDLADLWQQTCKKKEVGFAPSREKVSSDLYLAQARLQSLRKAAFAFFRSDEIKEVLLKVSVHVDKKLIMIREDRDLHIDMGLKQIVLELLLCYNPLWLRIALEVVYGRTVPLDSNSDVVGLATFIVNNVLTDQHIVATYSHPTVPHLMLPGFQDAMKKFTLKKFLFIVYFLDKAKTSKMIGHDPCLFMRQAKFKDSRNIILAFSRELLGGVGDIIRHLAVLGYKLSVKQQYLDEFEYAVKSLLDLRDGVHLTRVMELITQNRSLSSKLRVPAISRLQKIHNVDVALQALCSAGYSICGDIQAKDLVEGHREKTLSFLWQIIYKFQAPRFANAAVRIQVWWHKLQLAREIRRRIKERKRAKLDAAAIKIQAFWRAYCARLHVAILREEQATIRAARERAAIVVQKHYRRHLAQKKLAGACSAANTIKAWYKGSLLTRELRLEFLTTCQAVIKVQAVCRGYITRKRFRELRKMAAALRIQTWYRRQRTARLIHMLIPFVKGLILENREKRAACIKIQSRFRATLAMKKERERYVALQKAALTIQKHFRAWRAMQIERNYYLSLRRATVLVQQHFRGRRAMKIEHAAYVSLKASVVLIQRRFVSYLAMKKQRAQFENLKSATVTIQRRFRAYRQMKCVRQEFLLKRKASIAIQRRWRGYHAVMNYQKVKKAAVVIQHKWKAIIVARKQRASYILLLNAVKVIQINWRAKKAMERQRDEFIRLRSAAVVLQRLWKGTLLMRKQHAEYLRIHSSVIFVQQKWRALSAMKLQRSDYMKTCSSVIKIQQQWRAYSAMKEERSKFIRLRKAAVTIQSWWLSQSEVKKERAAFRRLRLATVVIQRHWRAQLAMRRDRCAFTLQVQSAVLIQRHVRGFLARLHVQRFRQQAKRWKETEDSAARKIQCTWRKWKQMQRETQLRNEAVTKIQSLWRGYSVRLKQSREIIASKDRVAQARKNASNELTLEAQWQEACQDIFHFSSDMGKVISSLYSLDTITKLSPILCIKCVESGLVQSLIDFLVLCNRSVVHQESCAIITSILLTLVKFELTTDSVWQEGKVLYLIMHQMKVWIGKEDKIFLNCATILWHFASDSEKEQVILREPRMKQTLEGFATKLKNKTTNKKPKYLPALKPTWGAKLDNPRPRSFDDPAHAVRCITSKLKITLNC